MKSSVVTGVPGLLADGAEHARSGGPAERAAPDLTGSDPPVTAWHNGKKSVRNRSARTSSSIRPHDSRESSVALRSN